MAPVPIRMNACIIELRARLSFNVNYSNCVRINCRAWVYPGACVYPATMPANANCLEEPMACGIVNSLSRPETKKLIRVNKAVKDGKWIEFNKHAVLIAEGVYVNNLKHGMWREYYDDTGSILIEENYRHGIQHGFYRSFHPNGQMLSEGSFDNGSREGYFRVYDEHGNHIKSILFVHNIKVEDIDEPAWLREEHPERQTGT